ncbi:MAG TPA: hypothetical protein VGC71_12030 [Gaiellales bacterium]
MRSSGTLLAGHLFYYGNVPGWQPHPSLFRVITHGQVPHSRLHMKILWTLHGGDPVRGLTIRGVSSDGSDSFRQFLPGGTEFPSYLNVPSAGCWQIFVNAGSLNGRLGVVAVDGT